MKSIRNLIILYAYSYLSIGIFLNSVYIPFLHPHAPDWPGACYACYVGWKMKPCIASLIHIKYNLTDNLKDTFHNGFTEKSIV